jgi:tetratricopeptide (TPR) repeat protein
MKRLWIGGRLFAALLVFGCGGAGQPPETTIASASDPCAGFDAAFSKVWNDEVKARLLAQARAQSDGDGGLGEVMVGTIEGFRDEWIDGQTTACREHSEKKVSDEAYRMQAGCFTSVLTSLSGALDAATSGQPGGSAGFVVGFALGPAQELEACKQVSGGGADERIAAQRLLAAANAASDPRAAFEQGEKAYALFKSNGDRHGMIDARRLTGVILFQAGEYGPARDYFAEALELARAEGGTAGMASGEDGVVLMVGPDSEQQAQRIELLNLVGLSEKKLHNLDAAIGYYTEALALAKSHFGEEDPQTATIMDNMGSVYGEMADFAKAVQYVSSALVIFRKTVGEKHRDTLTCLNNLAQHYDGAGLLDDAVKTYRQVLEVQEEVMGADHPMRGITLDNLGVALSRGKQYDEALKCQTEALEILVGALGASHPEVALVHGNMGRTYEASKQTRKALSHYQTAHDMLLEFFDASHPSVVGMKKAIDRLSR